MRVVRNTPAARDKHSFRMQKAEESALRQSNFTAQALARQREQELEKLKCRLEQALVAVKRKAQAVLPHIQSREENGRGSCQASTFKDPAAISRASPRHVLRCHSGSQFDAV